MVQQDRYLQKANRFVKSDLAIHPTKNSYLLDHEIDASEKVIKLIYGGANISKQEIKNLEKKLPIFELQKSTLDIQIGFGNKEEDEINPLAAELLSKERQIEMIEEQLSVKTELLDSIQDIRTLSQNVFRELSVQYPAVSSLR